MLPKADLLQYLADLPWIASVSEPTLVDEETGWWKTIVREVHNDSAVYRAIHFYETPEGCYWKDSEPVPELQPPEVPTYKMVTLRTILDAMGSEAYTPMRLRLSTAAEQSVVMADIVKMLETYGPDGGIDINAESTKTMIQSLVESGILTQSEADAVIALAD